MGQPQHQRHRAHHTTKQGESRQGRPVLATQWCLGLGAADQANNQQREGGSRVKQPGDAQSRARAGEGADQRRAATEQDSGGQARQLAATWRVHARYGRRISPG